MKTKVPTLRVLARQVDVYLARNTQSMLPHLTAPQVAALTAFIECLRALILALGSAPLDD